MTQLAFTWPGEERRLDMNGADRELVSAMESRQNACPIRWSRRPVNDWHAPHPYAQDGRTVQCPGLVTRPCGQNGPHNHHRWAEPDAFYWCQPLVYMRPLMSVDSVSRRS